MSNKENYGDPVWENLFQKGWGKYPPEEVVRFYFRKVKNEFKSPKTLDIGSGQGACSWFMTKEGSSVSAFDGSPTGLKNVSVIAKEFGVTNTIDLILGDITKPDKYFSNTFDVLLDNYSLYSNPEDEVSNALMKYYNIMNGGGVFLMNCFGEKTSGYDTGTQLSKNTFRDVEGSLKDRGIITWYNRSRLNELFSRIGFQISYTEDLSEDHNGVITEKLITCLKK